MQLAQIIPVGAVVSKRVRAKFLDARVSHSPARSINRRSPLSPTRRPTSRPTSRTLPDRNNDHSIQARTHLFTILQLYISFPFVLFVQIIVSSIPIALTAVSRFAKNRAFSLSLDPLYVFFFSFSFFTSTSPSIRRVLCVEFPDNPRWDRIELRKRTLHTTIRAHFERLIYSN